jgi:hypothetical protein
MDVMARLEYERVIDEICLLNWAGLSGDATAAVARAYYYFSIQFRENLRIARGLYPDDGKLCQLEREECDTDNLSPWPGIAAPGEKMNHDEFMRRTLELQHGNDAERARLDALGQAYLAETRSLEPAVRAMSIASYEDGGLERVFRAFLTAPTWDSELLRAFRHFLSEHIRFDSDPDAGHGALSRHMAPTDRVLPLWTAFRDLLVASVPSLVD